MIVRISNEGQYEVSDDDIPELNELDNQAVAHLVGRSPGAVRVAAHRGLRRLAATLRERTGPR